ncbi:multidrug effflux MFS transporter [Flagellimonas allohymeniacidonis]|uniref:Bcr/CflA family efflux MFS transporter n=1 Tax=Flagellimonas allohymeniacidonis TaxID=2517819 RepID=A0A4Q8QKH8_9FLAO|nr:multidrug effflux MFS transporter [Allomuricauda hymeniacidonis]TAI49293.1 Bcr/CflA family efflux MFS transporter [Allomuricauda hymeniacidonis]
MQNDTPKPSFEFMALMAALMSVVALSIDTLLPAISNIGASINSTDPTDNQMLITMIFLGLGVGQLFFGPLSDSYGRKPIVYLGIAVFAVASVICLAAPNLEWMVVGRILQGIGLSAARTISISIIRDMYKGDLMARVMSFVTAFFILVPVVAPALGKFILDLADWRAIFYIQLVLTIAVGVWFWKRQPETLRPEYKIPFSNSLFMDGFKELLRYKETVAFTIISGLVTGSFLVYLSASQYIFEDQYGLKEAFPYIFAGLAISIGLSTFFNGTLVLRFGMRKLGFMALASFCVIALLYVLLFWNSSNPNVFVLVTFLSLQFFCLGFMWGNFRSIAMEPIGHIAGIGAAINGFFSTVIAIPIATLIGSFVDDRVLPLFVGLAICGLLSMFVFLLVWRPKKAVRTA